jgi:hypothetical protein
LQAGGLTTVIDVSKEPPWTENLGIFINPALKY